MILFACDGSEVIVALWDSWTCGEDFECEGRVERGGRPRRSLLRGMN